MRKPIVEEYNYWDITNVIYQVYNRFIAWAT